MPPSSIPVPTHQASLKSRLKADLTLLLVSAIWGSAFAAQRVAALHLNAFFFNGLRFFLGAVVLLPLARGSWKRFNREAFQGAALAGLLLFGAAALQQIGIESTTAGNAGFITSLYVVLTPIFLAIGWRQRPGLLTWLASLLAVLGLFLLSTGGRLALAPGDGLELAGAVLWSFHVIWIGRLVHQVEILPLAVVQSIVCTILNLLAAGLSGGGFAPGGLQAAGWAVVYTGIFSIGIGYTLQAYGQRSAPPADAALLLSAEAVFAAFFGWLFLSERLLPIQLFGCGLILTGMLLAQAGVFTRSRAEN